MASSLRDIPGANRRTTAFRRRRATFAPRPGPPILIDPRASLYDRARPSGRSPRRPALHDRRRRIAPVDLALGLSVVAIVLFLGWQLWTATRVDVDITGIEDDGAITFAHSEQLDVRITVDPRGRLEGATVQLDGVNVDDETEKLADGFRWRTDRPLTAGDHQLVLTVPRPILPAARFVWDFEVDGAPPSINVPTTLLDPVTMDAEITISGTVDTDATLTANGDEVDVDEDGAFTVTFETPPAGPIRLEASDRAGQKTTKEIFVPIKRPVTRGVHMSAISWSEPDLRDAVLDLADRGIINAVEIDIKDEGGEVGWPTSVALAKEIGAVKRYFDLADAVKELKARDLYVIGRVVAFRDPILAEAAWAKGKRDWVMHGPDGEMLGVYGGFTNFMSPEVRKYNIDLALEAIDLGVDEILWDYVRRPEGTLGTDVVIPGITDLDPFLVQDHVAEFLREAHVPIRAAGALQGASLFGVASLRPETVGQSVPLIAKAVDYIAPMVYPSLWVKGEYRVADPPRMPYQIVTRSLEDFKKKVQGTGVTLVPWLQDFSLITTYDDDDVLAQVQAAEGLGIEGFLLWSPRVRYHAELIPPLQKR